MKWIAIADELPPFGVQVLCWCAGSEHKARQPMFVSHRYVKNKKIPGRALFYEEVPRFPVTHWTPLPAPPSHEIDDAPSANNEASP